MELGRVVSLAVSLGVTLAACTSPSPGLKGSGGTSGSGGAPAASTSSSTSSSTASASVSSAASNSASSTTNSSSSTATSGASSTGTSSGASSSTSGSTDGGLAPDTALVRVHYPAGSHALTIRGSAGGLGWTAGKPMTATSTTFTYTLSALTAPAEWKPLLDDATWSRGPNYRVGPGQTIDVWPHFTTTKGQVVTLIPTFHSTTLANDRAVYAYLPASYGENTLATFPVVYMHDGQNLWAALPQLAFGAPWNVDTAFDTATEVGACSTGGVIGWGAQPLGGTPVTCTGDGDCPSAECRTFPEAIVIGVANTSNRIYEYTPTTDPGTAGGGGADLYVKMLVQELKPAIDGMLRTRPDVASTALAGSSLGGLVTAYAGLQHPEVFGMLGEISPSSWWNNDIIVTDVKTTAPTPMRPLLVYVDSGQGTVDDQADTDLLAAAYLGLGYVDGKTFRHVVQPGAVHNETYWAQRFPGAMQLLLGVR